MVKLSDLKKGQSGTVAEIATKNESILRKLMAMGILPGVRVSAVQTFPSFVFQAGYTQIAVDKQIASVILVELDKLPK